MSRFCVRNPMKWPSAKRISRCARQAATMSDAATGLRGNDQKPGAIGLSVSAVCADADVPQNALAKIATTATPKRLVMIAPTTSPRTIAPSDHRQPRDDGEPITEFCRRAEEFAERLDGRPS